MIDLQELELNMIFHLLATIVLLDMRSHLLVLLLPLVGSAGRQLVRGAGSHISILTFSGLLGWVKSAAF